MGLDHCSPKAVLAMEEANRIYDDFPTGKYWLFTAAFAIEIAIVFYLAS